MKNLVKIGKELWTKSSTTDLSTHTDRRNKPLLGLSNALERQLRQTQCHAEVIQLTLILYKCNNPVKVILATTTIF